VPRQLRIEYEGAIYHLLSRGDRREDIFWEDRDRQTFLRLLEQTCARTGWQVHAYCLMSNHFHLVAETPRPNLVAGMKWLLGTYTMRFNRRHRLNGHLFAGRYKSLLIDESDPVYLRAVCDYVHLNPMRAGLVEEDEPLESYEWSSYPAYLARARLRAGWMRCDRLLGEHGLGKETPRSRVEFRRRMEALRTETGREKDKQIREGWLYGAQDFIARLVERLEKEIGEHHLARERSQTDEELAERIVRAGMKELGWREEELGRRRKGDLGKVRIANELRSHTSVNLKWIARRLEMGSWSHVSNLLTKAKSANSED
jgi:putative transposase